MDIWYILTILQTVVPSDKIGRVMSIDHTISMAIAPIGALMAGPMADLIGINTLFVICAFVGIIYPFLLWIFTKIRYLEYPREKEEIVVPKQEIIELKTQKA